MSDTTFPAIDVSFDFKNNEWALAHLPNVRIATLLLQRDDIDLTETMQGFVRSDCAVDVVERLCHTKEHLEALVEVLTAALARSFIVLERLGYSAENPLPGLSTH